MPSNSEQLAALQARLTLIRSAISGTLTRGVAEYNINGRSLKSFTLPELMAAETRTINEIKRLQRGSRFGAIGFKRVSS